MKLALKGLMAGIVLSMMCTGVQATTIECIGDVVSVDKDEIFADPFSAPNIRVTIDNAYKKKGEKISFRMKLDEAVWFEGNYTVLTAKDIVGSFDLDYTITIENEKTALVELRVPADFTESQTLAMTIPLLIRAEDKEPTCTIEEKTNSGLIPSEKILLGTGEGKKATWKMTQPISYDLDEKIIMAPITFTEIKAGYISEDGFTVKIKMEDPHYEFVLPAYSNVQYNDADTEYTICSDGYLEYLDGFEGAHNDFKIKIDKKDPTSWYITMRGQVPSKPGKIVLKNIPIKMVSENRGVDDIKISISGDDIIGNENDVTAAYVIWRDEEPQIDETSKEEGSSQGKEITQQPAEIAKDKREVQFIANKDYYLVNGISHTMEAKPYLDDGSMLIPVRYAAMAFGGRAQDIVCEGKDITFKIADKQIMLKLNSDKAVVNGQVIKMEVSTKLVKGRIYIPVGEIGRLLGGEKQWNSVTKTATFSC